MGMEQCLNGLDRKGDGIKDEYFERKIWHGKFW